MLSLGLGFCIAAAFFYSWEMVTQEHKWPDISPVVITFALGVGIALYGIPVVFLEWVSGKKVFGPMVWPQGQEWVLIFAIPVIAFAADWCHFESIFHRTGSVILATMYMAIPVLAMTMKLELPTQLRCVAWLFTLVAMVILVRGKIFTEGDDPVEEAENGKIRSLKRGIVMAICATCLYSGEIVVQEALLSHVSFTVLAAAGGAAISFYAGCFILIHPLRKKLPLRFPRGKEWRWAAIIPLLSLTADCAHFGALHVKAGSVTLSLFYMTCPIWATMITWKRPTKWHLWAWAFGAVGILLLVL